jgi:hypothetical protein
MAKVPKGNARGGNLVLVDRRPGLVPMKKTSFPRGQKMIDLPVLAFELTANTDVSVNPCVRDNLSYLAIQLLMFP